MIELLNRLHKSGELKKLYRAGYISSKVFTEIDVLNKYNSISNMKKVEKVAKLASMMRLSDRTIYRILKKLELE